MITQAELKTVISYDPLTGVFTWIKSRGFIKAGREAGGQACLDYKGKRYLKIRLAWLYMTGIYPNKVYAINHNNGDLQFENLTINNDKKTVNLNHVDIGVLQNDNSYHAFIVDKGKTIDLGIHSDIDTVLQVIKGRLCSR